MISILKTENAKSRTFGWVQDPSNFRSLCDVVNVSFEMLATKGADREYLRTRRAYIIKKLSESKNAVSADDMVSYLAENGIAATRTAVIDDVRGLRNIGLYIEASDDSFTWRDAINALQLLTEECGYAGAHLGGSRKPDGVVYTTALTNNYGVIIDTKAYANGYNLPISQTDEMQRYIQENRRRDKLENPTKWWENFGGDVRGAAVAISELLLMADSVKDAKDALLEAERQLFGLYIYSISCETSCAASVTLVRPPFD